MDAAARKEPDRQLARGELFADRYQVEELLGRGGMGAVSFSPAARGFGFTGSWTLCALGGPRGLGSMVVALLPMERAHNPAGRYDR